MKQRLEQSTTALNALQKKKNVESNFILNSI